MLCEKLPKLEELGSVREGIFMVFRGQEPDENGEPEGQYVEVTLVVPPLNFATVKRMRAEAAADAKNGKVRTRDEEIEQLVTTIERALKRNYRGVPRWLIEQSIDMGNSVSITQEIMGLSMLEPKKREAETTPDPSTGTNSTAS